MAHFEENDIRLTDREIQQIAADDAEDGRIEIALNQQEEDEQRQRNQWIDELDQLPDMPDDQDREPDDYCDPFEDAQRRAEGGEW